MEWVKFDEKHPPRRADVLVTDGISMGVTKVQFDNNNIMIQFGRHNCKGRPTHWRALPDLPTE